MINPGNYAYDDDRHKQASRFKTAVKRAGFLDEQQKRRWGMMAYLLTQEQLQTAEQLIIAEDLKHLKTRQQLEKLKPKPRH